VVHIPTPHGLASDFFSLFTALVAVIKQNKHLDEQITMSIIIIVIVVVLEGCLQINYWITGFKVRQTNQKIDFIIGLVLKLQRYLKYYFGFGCLKLQRLVD